MDVKGAADPVPREYNKMTYLRCGVLCLVCLFAACSEDRRSAQVVPPELVTPDLSDVDADVANLLRRMLAAAEKENSADAWGELAMALEVNGFAEAAIQGYQLAQALAPTDGRWPYYLALLTAHRGDLETALRHLETSIERSPGYAPAWLWRASWQMDLGMADAAALSYQKASELGVGDVARIGEAAARLELAQANEVLELLASVADDARVVRYRIRALRQLGRDQAASALLAQVDKYPPATGPLTWPDDRTMPKKAYEVSGGARLAEARRLLDEGKPASALTLLDQLAARDPDHQGLLSARIEALRQLGRRAEMATQLQRAVTLYPDYYGFHLSLAEYFLEEGDREKAAQHLTATISLNDQIPWAHAQLGLMFVEQNRLSQAVKAFGTALELAPDNPQVNYYLGMIHANQQNWTEAVRRFDVAVAEAPTFTVAWIALARSLWSSGNRDGARRALAQAERLGTHPNEVAAARTSIPP